MLNDISKMSCFIHNIFNFFTHKKRVEETIHQLNISDIKSHFSSIRPDDEYVEDTFLIDKIKSILKPNRKNVFIIDDNCEIVKIVTSDFNNYLKTIDRVDDFNVIQMCKKTAGFDMLSIIAKYPEIRIDGLIADIILGGNEKINGKKIIVDAVDLVILLKSINPDVKYSLFTGTPFSAKNENGSRVATKFENFFEESILSVTFMKDANVVFDDAMFSRIVS